MSTQQTRADGPTEHATLCHFGVVQKDEAINTKTVPENEQAGVQTQPRDIQFQKH